MHKVGTRSGVLINHVSFFQRCPLRGVPLYSCVECPICLIQIHDSTAVSTSVNV